ncbi:MULTISPECIES: porin [Silvimonas]|uniref:porin n=1 Tax=Silvimonas TaxID=300264 RepID=UPI0024B3963C|nr:MULTISPECIES: porin [Silvimonas]MDR3426534.1 porin [Silvimonas sp.]
MLFKRKLFYITMLGCFYASAPAFADQISDLKAEIAAQKKQSADQQAKLDALEKKLDATIQSQQQAAPAVSQRSQDKPSLALTTDQEGVKIKSDDSALMLYNNGTSSLRIYGLVEGTLSYANHQTESGGNATGYQTAWFSGNRLGFDASHALGFGESLGMPDLKVISKLETEFELPTGNMDTENVLFNRDAWMGVYSDSLGKITLGRQNTLTRDFTQNWGDPYGSASTTLKEGGYSNVNNFKQLIFYSGGPDGTRSNSAIEWKKRFGDHIVAGLGYTFGSGGSGGSGDVGNGGSTPGDFTKGTGQAASIAYNKLQLGDAVVNANVSYDRANINELIHQSELVGGNIAYGRFRVNAGYLHYTAQQGDNNSAGTRSDNAWTISGTYTFGPTEYALGYQQTRGTHSGLNAAGKVINPYGNTEGVTATADGGKNAVYGSIMYHADKQFDLYVAADYFTTTGDWVLGDAQGNGMLYGTGQAYKGTVEVATGARYKF